MEALKAGRITVVVTKHLSGDMEDLELESEADLTPLLIELLEEIIDAGPIECYAGTHPPQRSYEPEIRALELWAYSWNSKHFQMHMYLKFALKNDYYVYVHCHFDRRERD